jgi:Protein of unknown function (DUF3570)
MKLAAVHRILGRVAAVVALLLLRATCADVLPDDRADLFYSKYSGGGMDITGESAALNKKFTENIAAQVNYFVDKVSGASIDVLSQASQIRDERIQKSATLEFVHDKTTYTASYAGSIERDYRSDTASIAMKQDMFGDLTTLSLAFANTVDKVGENNGTAFVPLITWLGHAQSRSYDIDWSQILTKNLIAGVNFNVITDQGYLANPYRSVRYLDAGTPKGYSLGSQVYPDTRTSTAVQAEAKYFLPYRAAITGSFRYFRDTWSIVGKTFEVDYTHPISNIWILEGRFRYYTQNHADFYSDLFQYADEYRFEARDQDLAAQDNYTIGAKATYAFLPNGWKMFKRATVTFDASRITFHYSDFRNIKYYGLPQYLPGTEPLYQFNATVYQIYMSMFF